MSKQDKVPRFLYDWRSALVAFPSMLLYGGFLPLLKVFGVVRMAWIWALAPIWMPFLGFWMIVGMVSFLVLITEISFLIIPDKDIFEGLKTK